MTGSLRMLHVSEEFVPRRLLEFSLNKPLSTPGWVPRVEMCVKFQSACNVYEYNVKGRFVF